MRYRYHIRVVLADSPDDAKGIWLKVTTKTPVNWHGTWPEARKHFKRHIPKGFNLVQFADG